MNPATPAMVTPTAAHSFPDSGCLWIFAAMMTASPVLAQEDDAAQDEAQQSSGGLTDIIVTATKRGSAQNVGLSQ